jgi:hypothetical protein
MNFEDEQSKSNIESEAAWSKQQLDRERSDIAESKRLFDESEAYAAKQREETKKRSAADRTFIEACEFAKNSMKSHDLQGEIRPFYEVRYTVKQGLKAAIHTREDGIATLVLQRAILVRLDFIKSLIWVAVLLLAYIAYKVS